MTYFTEHDSRRQGDMDGVPSIFSNRMLTGR
jgi:hypothetical protein